MTVEDIIRKLFKTARSNKSREFFSRDDESENALKGPIGQYDLGKEYMQNGRYYKALLHLTLELEVTPNSPETLWRAAKCNEELKNYDEAVRLYINSLKNKIDDNVFAHFFDCYRKIYGLDDSEKKAKITILEKAWLSINDRIVKGEEELTEIRDYLEQNFMKIKN